MIAGKELSHSNKNYEKTFQSIGGIAEILNVDIPPDVPFQKKINLSKESVI